MLVNRIFTVAPYPAKTWENRARFTPLLVRRAMGKNLKLLLVARRVAKQTTIYNKGLKPPGRFTYALLNGDRPFVEGDTFGVSCNVKSKRGFAYAQKRNDAKGYSKRYKTRLDSKFAQIAVAETRRKRAQNIREAMREVNRMTG